MKQHRHNHSLYILGLLFFFFFITIGSTSTHLRLPYFLLNQQLGIPVCSILPLARGMLFPFLPFLPISERTMLQRAASSRCWGWGTRVRDAPHPHPAPSMGGQWKSGGGWGTTQHPGSSVCRRPAPPASPPSPAAPRCRF